MKLRRLIYKRKISILGLLMFVIIGTTTLIFKIIKLTAIELYKLFKWIKNYIHFCKSGYCYSDICNLIKSMTGREFEIFMYLVFKELGYKAKLTQPTADYGRDIILRDIDDSIIYVECKRWSEDRNLIGREIVQKLSGAMNMFSVNQGIIITTGKYHKNAIESANMIGNIELWDMKDIMFKVFKINQKKIPYILSKTFDNNTKIIRLRPSVN